jgi:hypothetical protein
MERERKRERQADRQTMVQPSGEDIWGEVLDLDLGWGALGK